MLEQEKNIQSNTLSAKYLPTEIKILKIYLIKEKKCKVRFWFNI